MFLLKWTFQFPEGHLKKVCGFETQVLHLRTNVCLLVTIHHETPFCLLPWWMVVQAFSQSSLGGGIRRLPPAWSCQRKWQGEAEIVFSKMLPNIYWREIHQPHGIRKIKIQNWEIVLSRTPNRSAELNKTLSLQPPLVSRTLSRDYRTSPDWDDRDCPRRTLFASFCTFWTSIIRQIYSQCHRISSPKNSA